MKNFPKYIIVDIMLNGQFLHTMQISTLLADEFDHGIPVFSVDVLKKHIIGRLPSLKGKDFKVCPN